MNVRTVRAIVLDLDGTLLTSDKRVSARNLHAVLALHEAGVSVILATARPPRAVFRFLPEELLQVSEIVFYNGAYFTCKKHGVEERVQIDAELAQEMYAFLARVQQEAFVAFEADDQFFSNRVLEEAHYPVFGIYSPEQAPLPVPMEQVWTRPLMKMLFAKIEQMTAFHEAFSERANIIVTDGGQLVQVMAKHASKQNAVLRMIELLGVDVASTMVFGDDLNDLELFHCFPQSVAMGNAVPQLKAVAQEITAANDQDGVALVLERLLSAIHVNHA